MGDESASVPNVAWASPKWKCECAGFIKLYDGWSWVVVEEFTESDLVWVHRNLITSNEYD